MKNNQFMSNLNRINSLVLALLVHFSFSNLSAVAAVFSNGGNVTINDNTTGSPYPSDITVSGQSGTISSLTVSLSGFAHTYPEDVRLAIVGPTGTAVMLMDQVSRTLPVSGLTLTFDDGAATSAFFLTGSGSYRPYSANSAAMTSPGPSTYTTTLSSFIGTNPNGVWHMYVEDLVGGDSGNISGGWSINMTITPIPETEHVAVAACLLLSGFAGYRRFRRRVSV